MKALVVVPLIVWLMSLPGAYAQGGGAVGAAATVPNASACARCATANASSHDTSGSATKPIPGTNETIVVGSIENLIPIGVLTVLGCEKCSAEAVNWALQQGSSFEEVERTLRTVAAMQNLDCFKSQFGPEVSNRMEKPLAAAKDALAQARMRAAK